MKTLLLVLALCLCFSRGSSQAKKEAKKGASDVPAPAKIGPGKIWGQTFLDYAYVTQARDMTNQGKNAFEFRRIYLGYDQDISEDFSARVLVEANKGETTTSGAMNLFAKQVYLEWKNLVPLSSIFIGLSPTPSLSVAERIWGYRSLEKVILDRTGLAGVYDMGVGLKGRVAPDGSVGYALMVGNGMGGKVEDNKLKKFYAEFNVGLSKESIAEIYADFENGPAGQSKITGKALVGYQSSLLSVGLEGFFKNVQRGSYQPVGSPLDSNLAGGSVSTSFPLAENIRGVLRADFLDADFSVKDEGTRELFGIAGIDFVVAKDVHLIPNALITQQFYKKKLSTDPTLNPDITARMTFAYTFSAQL